MGWAAGLRVRAPRLVAHVDLVNQEPARGEARRDRRQERTIQEVECEDGASRPRWNAVSFDIPDHESSPQSQCRGGCCGPGEGGVRDIDSEDLVAEAGEPERIVPGAAGEVYGGAGKSG